MMTLHVKVTFRDILLGVPTEPLICPIARATRRALEAAGDRFMLCGVDRRSLTLWMEGCEMVVPLPPPATAFVERLDDLGFWHVRPFAFDLELPAATPAPIPAEALA
jgi:hypothetical protein